MYHFEDEEYVSLRVDVPVQQLDKHLNKRAKEIAKESLSLKEVITKLTSERDALKKQVHSDAWWETIICMKNQEIEWYKTKTDERYI